MGKQIKSNALLMLTALIWGSAFVAQKSGMDLIGPLAFNGIRTLIGSVVLLPLIAVANAYGTGSISASEGDKKAERKTTWIGGICCGIVLFFAGNLQQIGIFYTSVSHSGFITALYVVVVPLFGLFLGKKVRPVMWCCIGAAALGLYLLSIPETGFGGINRGDMIVLASAILFAVHILVIDHFSPKVVGIKLSCIQFLVAGGLSLVFMAPVDTALGFDLPSMGNLLDCWLPILYSGVLSCGAGYTLQIVAQKNADPAIASMIMCLESVFALLAGMVLLGEALSMRETVGCIIMFAAIVVANLPEKNALK